MYVMFIAWCSALVIYCIITNVERKERHPICLGLSIIKKVLKKKKTTDKLVMNHCLSEAVAAIDNDFDHSQCLNRGMDHKCVNECVPAKQCKQTNNKT